MDRLWAVRKCLTIAWRNQREALKWCGKAAYISLGFDLRSGKAPALSQEQLADLTDQVSDLMDQLKDMTQELK